MAYTTINKPEDYFNTVLYTGNGSARTITGVGFQPDWVWVKGRSALSSHYLYDVVRGDNVNIFTNSNSAEVNVTTGFTGGGIGSQASDGFNIVAGTSNTDNVNTNSATYKAWNWLAGGTPSSNTDGSITSSVSANTTAGFSIGTYSGNGISDATIGHGLSSAPEVIIVKRRTGADNWQIYWNTGTERNGFLNLPNAFNTPAATAQWGTNVPTSSVFYVGNDNSNNASSNDYVFYAFHSVKGYSKFGEYTGNGSADGPFIYTGFKPEMTIIKNIGTGWDWLGQDATTQEDANFDGNPVNTLNQVNTNTAETNASTRSVDYLSNGFKIRNTSGAWNTSGNTFIYITFAERSLVGTNNIPALAR